MAKVVEILPYLAYNTIAVDDLATQGSKSSTVVVKHKELL